MAGAELAVVAAAEVATEVTADDTVDTDALTLSDATEETVESALDTALETVLGAALDAASLDRTVDAVDTDALAVEATLESDSEVRTLEASENEKESWELLGAWASLLTARRSRAHRAESLVLRRAMASAASREGAGKARGRARVVHYIVLHGEGEGEKFNCTERRVCHGAVWGRFPSFSSGANGAIK